MKKIISSLFCLIACSAIIIACCHEQKENASDNNTVFQVSTLQSLMDGGYDGIVTVAELKNNGNIGLGTFDRINGEMIVLNDTVFQALWDGSVVVADNSTTVPFADVTTFTEDLMFASNYALDMNGLSSQLDSVLQEFETSNIRIVKMEGQCQSITVRSEKPQTPPYSPLVEVLPTAECSFTYENISGTFVAMWFPSDFATISGSGWHYHFLSSDRKLGGHVLSLNGASNLHGAVCMKNQFTTSL